MQDDKQAQITVPMNIMVDLWLLKSDGCAPGFKAWCDYPKLIKEGDKVKWNYLEYSGDGVVIKIVEQRVYVLLTPPFQNEFVDTSQMVVEEIERSITQDLLRPPKITDEFLQTATDRDYIKLILEHIFHILIKYQLKVKKMNKSSRSECATFHKINIPHRINQPNIAYAFINAHQELSTCLDGINTLSGFRIYESTEDRYDTIYYKKLSHNTFDVSIGLFTTLNGDKIRVVDGIHYFAYSKPISREVFETRWALQVVDDMDPEFAANAAKLING